MPLIEKNLIFFGNTLKKTSPFVEMVHFEVIVLKRRNMAKPLQFNYLKMNQSWTITEVHIKKI